MSYGPSRNNRGAGNPGSQPVTFTLGDAKRIGDAVHQVETGRRSRKVSSLPRATGGGALPTATFFGQWLKMSNKIINFGDGTTANCTNLMVDVLSYSGPRKCIVTTAGDGYTLVNVECG
jgi:hypothetical protein